jgi:hypothetical protein
MTENIIIKLNKLLEPKIPRLRACSNSLAERPKPRRGFYVEPADEKGK